MFPSGWFSGVTPLDVWAAVLALLVTGTVVLGVVKVVHPIAQKITRVLDAFLGRPASQGIPAIPGVIERLDAQDAVQAKQGETLIEQGRQLAEVLAQVKEQVTPNHGSTSKLAEDVQALKSDLAVVVARLDGRPAKP